MKKLQVANKLPFYNYIYQSSNHFWTREMFKFVAFKFDSSIWKYSWNSFSRNIYKKKYAIDWNQFAMFKSTRDILKPITTPLLA